MLERLTELERIITRQLYVPLIKFALPIQYFDCLPIGRQRPVSHVRPLCSEHR
jgi:hypothetical protein